MLSQDSFYRGLTKDELENVASYNFDVPSAFDVPAMVGCLRDLRAMKAVDVPVYDFTRHARDETRARRVEQQRERVLADGHARGHALGLDADPRDAERQE